MKPLHATRFALLAVAVSAATPACEKQSAEVTAPDAFRAEQAAERRAEKPGATESAPPKFFPGTGAE